MRPLNVLNQKLARTLLADGPREAIDVVVGDPLHRMAFILTKLEDRIIGKMNLRRTTRNLRGPRCWNSTLSWRGLHVRLHFWA